MGTVVHHIQKVLDLGMLLKLMLVYNALPLICTVLGSYLKETFKNNIAVLYPFIVE